MSSQFPNGTIFSISTVIAAAKACTAITNANPGVAAVVGNGYANGDILLPSLASTRLDQRPVRVAADATDSFALEGIDTTSATLFPTGFGVGSFQKVSSFVPFSQTTDVQSSGGDQQFAQWTYLEDGAQHQRPTFKTARSLTLKSDYDPSQAWHTALLTADQDGSTRILLATLPSGAKIYWSVNVSFSGEPSFTINQNQQVVSVFSMVSQLSTRYAS